VNAADFPAPEPAGLGGLLRGFSMIARVSFRHTTLGDQLIKSLVSSCAELKKRLDMMRTTTERACQSSFSSPVRSTFLTNPTVLILLMSILN
jgi:hypothetical protein